MQKVLVTGGAGYIGSVLCRLLLENDYKVHVIDSLLHGGDSIVELLNNPNFEFTKGDVRNENEVKPILNGVDHVVNLAAIVGDPACAQSPELAKETNLDAVINLYKHSTESNVKKFIFASTCSNYGKMSDDSDYVNEDSTLAPVSLYAETKVGAESFLLSQDKNSTCKPTCLRFSTVYGISPRLRFDLTVNEFVKELVLGRELVIFGEQFWRPYCHVVDLARSVITTLKADHSLTDFEVFNVGSTDQNFQKKMLADEIKKQLPEAKIKYVEKNEDPRDYRVAFEKINEKLGFKITKTVPEGIEDLIFAFKNGLISNPDDPKFSNI